MIDNFLGVTAIGLGITGVGLLSTIPTWTHVENHVQNHAQNQVQNRVQNHVQNHVRKIKNIANKNMSFLKITDPKKRDFIVNSFLRQVRTSNKTFYPNVKVTWPHNTNFQSSSNQLRTCKKI